MDYKGRCALEVHHLHYDTLGNETLKDVLVVCPPCHRLADAERALATADKRWESRVFGWADKAYGDDAVVIPFETLEARFEAWLEDRGEQMADTWADVEVAKEREMRREMRRRER